MSLASAGQLAAPSDTPAVVQAAVFRRLFGPTATWVAAGVLLLAVIHPPHGLGISLCALHAATGIPCPGCGLSRSLSCTVRGDLASAWAYHPFGPILLPILAGIVVVRLLPRSAREWLATCCGRNERVWAGGYATLVGAFILFGVLRAGLSLWRGGG